LDFLTFNESSDRIYWLKYIQVTYNKAKLWDIALLVLRIWLGYRLITASLSSVTGMLSSEKEREFFRKWFGDELHFPMPLLMAFLAKGSELVGGIFLIAGIFTKPAASVVAFTMIIATLTANLGENFVIDGGFTISYTLFAMIFIIWGAGRYSLDHVFARKRERKNYTGEESIALKPLSDRH
jgi:putative oxidoreductase